MTHQTETTWQQDMHFVSKLDEKEVHFDATALTGKHDQGVSPKKILLSSLAGCTGMDVVALLNNKFKVDFQDFNLKVSGELTEEHPKYYHKLHIVYQIRVAEADRAHVEKAVELSRERYCGVSAMLAKAAEITHEIQYL